MRHLPNAVLALIMSAGLACAQGGVAPPGPVEAQPLAPPAGGPVQAQSQPSNPTPPAPLPVEPQPVQPAPAPSGPVVPQPVQPAPTPSVPLEPSPVQPPPALPVPQPLPAPAPPQRTETVDPNATLAGKRGDSSEVDTVALVAKPMLAVAGQASWDQGFVRLQESQRLLRESAAKAGLAVAGRPLTLFVETSDDGFRYEAMLPVAGAPPVGTVLAEGVRAGETPSGQALRFLHLAPYDDIDATYETITAYLEAKSIVVKDAFLEEYVSDLTDPGDPNLEINVYVQPR